MRTPKSFEGTFSLVGVCWVDSTQDKGERRPDTADTTSSSKGVADTKKTGWLCVSKVQSPLPSMGSVGDVCLPQLAKGQ